MFDRSVATVAVLCLFVGAGGAGAQGLSEREALAQRIRIAEARLGVLRAAELEEARDRAPDRRGVLVRAGRLSVVVWQSVGLANGRALAVSADSMIAAFGVVPDSALERLVLTQIQVEGVDSLLAAMRLAGRERVEVDWNGEGDAAQGSWAIVRAATAPWFRGLDAAWTGQWLPEDLSHGWTAERDGQGALRDLTQPEFDVGRACLAGTISACVMLLGLDDTRDPLATRYSSEDLRRVVASFGERDFAPAVCVNRDVAACSAYLSRRGSLRTVPASPALRNSLLRALREHHGAPVVRAALERREGSIGERFAQATGVSADSLARAWRAWVLTRGNPERVDAGVRALVPPLIVTLLLAGLAMRRSPWVR